MDPLPCRSDPERWWSHDYRVLGLAVHDCLRHCPWLRECRGEPPAPDGVIGGVLYTRLGLPHFHQPAEVKCGRCDTQKAWNEPGGACGTEAGWSRHRRAKEDPCTPCKAAKSAANVRRNHARPPKPEPPPADIYEERRRVLAAALKSA